ncbi:MAG TPA: hypothetical protein VEU62_15080 [Bryobacterales bacterium]|nr:hypothetical protein [Bryobacterales bacterium]
MLNSISALNSSLLSQIQQTGSPQNTQRPAASQKTTSPQGDTVQISQAAKQALTAQKTTDADGDNDGH